MITFLKFYKNESFNFIRPTALIFVLLGVISCGGSGGGNSTPVGPSIPAGPTAPAPTNTDGYVDTLNNVRNQYSLPAAAGMLLHNDDVVFIGATGVRSLASDIAVTENDLWHLGSITKSMTATLAGRLVEQQLISWDTSIRDIFPQLVLQGNGQFDNTTLEQLLAHHSGLQRDLSWTEFADPNMDVTQLRNMIVATALNTPAVNNGDEFHYSNLGFVVAGAMLEAVTGESWEQLMEEQVFQPLEILDAGFGPPGDGTSQPNGHLSEGNAYTPLTPDSSGSDNPPAIGPAGTIHMSLPSLAKYARAHMVGQLGESELLSSATFSYLHQTFAGSDYALGWFVQPDALFHDGSNNLWFAKLSVSQQHQLVIISVTNAGGQDANAATDDITNGLLNVFFGN